MLAKLVSERSYVRTRPPSPECQVFTGSAVVDVNNTSGFFPDQDNGVIAIYTLACYYPEGPGPQTQNIAYSLDGGYTFTTYANNPVLDINSTQFRDPKVVWYPATESWVMVISYANDYTVGIYTSPNLLDWSHASNFSHKGILGIQYECPNLVEMPMEGSDETMYVTLLDISSLAFVDMLQVADVALNQSWSTTRRQH